MSNMRTSDPLTGRSRGDAATAVVNARLLGAQGDFQNYIETVYKVAPALGLDPAIVIAQAALETGHPDTGAPFQSDYWIKDHNPAGIGIWRTGAPTPFDIRKDAKPGRLAALIHLAELYVRIHRIGPDNLKEKLPAPLQEIADIDGDHLWKVARIFQHPKAPNVETINDLNRQFFDDAGSLQCTWACDEKYEKKLVERSKLLLPNIPAVGDEKVALVFGKVPHPKYERRILAPGVRAQGDGWYMSNRPMDILGVVDHRMVGSLWGTDSWFRGAGRGLTHYGVGVGSIDGADNDGKILMWVDPAGTAITSQASGPWERQEDVGTRGWRLVDKYGISAINGRLVSIEVSGQYDTPVSERAIDALAALHAYWADQKQIPWDKYPLNPASGLTFEYEHGDFQEHKQCMGPAMRRVWPQVIAETKAILKHYQQSESVPTYPKPVNTPKWDGRDKVAGGTTWYAIHKQVHAGKGGAQPRAWAGDSAPVSAPEYPENKLIEVRWKVQAKGGKWYWVDEKGGRIPSSQIREKVEFPNG